MSIKSLEVISKRPFAVLLLAFLRPLEKVLVFLVLTVSFFVSAQREIRSVGPNDNMYSTVGEVGFVKSHRASSLEATSFEMDSFLLESKIIVSPSVLFNSQIEFYKNEDGSSDFKLNSAQLIKMFQNIHLSAGVLFPRVGLYREDLGLFYSRPIVYSEFQIHEAMPGVGLLLSGFGDQIGINTQVYHKTVNDNENQEQLSAEYTPFAVSNWWRLGDGELSFNYYQNQLAFEQYVQSKSIGFRYLIPLEDLKLALKLESWSTTLFEDKGLNQIYRDIIINPVIEYKNIGLSYLKLARASSVSGISFDVAPENQEIIQLFYSLSSQLKFSIEQNVHVQLGENERSLKSESVFKMAFRL